ncbi:FAD-dependent oxidoreductase [Aestuariivirga litoralis]|uniref:FAD-dependent oxidoreductase n=1 Tax=Aestuariivirga litoralis TaxID=2650924 RepID=A0A2W2BFG5_9HYPH|nr:FAD-binding oxidoreductase [Aestuariivirga litoralis]PZF79004.1 FAD-dependent oxidoreductase [Aestuariivirga litoralis]
MSLRSVRRLPVHTGPAGWSEILGPVPAQPALRGPAACDVAIVGAGFAGLSAARRLRQMAPGARIAILEAGRVAEGGAGRNSGFMIDLPHDLTSRDYAGGGAARDLALTRLNRQAIDFAAAAVDELGIPEGYFQRAGKINGAASARGLAANQSYAAHLAALGEPHELLDAATMREITGSTYYRGGLFTPGTAMLQPAGYVRGLAAGLVRQGVALFEQSPVLRFESTGDGWQLSTAQGSLAAAKVILASNGHLESFGFRSGRLMHIMLNACMTAELDEDQLRRLGGAACWGITPADAMGTTLRRIGPAQGGNRLVIRQGGYYRPDMQTSDADLQRLVRRMRHKFMARFPALGDVGFAYAWSGHLCLSQNGVSVMRELEPGLFAACVCNGLGTARGTLMGMAAAELACGRTSDITGFFLAEGAPAKLPPHPVDAIGANAYMRWKEWQARHE